MLASGVAANGVRLTATLMLGTSAGALASVRDPVAMAQAIVDKRDGSPPPGARTASDPVSIPKHPELLAEAQSGEAG